jgi:MFS family permease
MGLLYMVRGIGATCGPLVARYLVGEKPEAMYRAIGVAFVFMASLYVVFSRMPTLVTAAVALCLGAMAANVLWVFSSTLLQLSVPDGYRGRIFATDFALLTIVMTLSTFLTGWAMDHFAIGPRPITTLVGLVLFLPGLWWLWCVARGAGPPAVPVSQSQTGHEV